MQQKTFLGNLSSKRDWGHAKDYVKAMYLILQQDKPDDYVIATGVTTTVRDFVKFSLAECGIQVIFKGEGVEEKGYIDSVDKSIFREKVGAKYLATINARIGECILEVDSRYFRPTEVDLLIGDPTKSNTVLGWIPKYDLPGLVADMMQSDIKLMKKESYLKEGGFYVHNYFE